MLLRPVPLLLLLVLAAALTYALAAASTVPATKLGRSEYNATNIPLDVTNITSADSDSTAGHANSGDSVSVTFNQALSPSSIPATGTITLVGGGSQTTITISSLSSAGGFVVATNYEKSGNTSSATVNFALSNGNQTVTATISGALSNSGNVKTGTAQTFTFTPAATVTDTNGTAAGGSHATPSALLLF